MSWDLILAIIFYALIVLFYFKNKKKFEVQSGIFFLYKTKWGLKLMDKLATKYPRTLKVLENISIVVSFIGMAFIFIFLFIATVKLILQPGSTPALAPVLPGIQISPDLPVLGFWHWIIAIFVVAVIHEFAHGVYARFHKIPVKSSGFAFLGPILAAFVEPDEKILPKKSKKAQLTVFSAGPFSNILLAIVLIILSLLIINPVATSFLEYQGVNVLSVEEDGPFAQAGILPGQTITSFNNVEIATINDFIEQINLIEPNQEITVSTLNESYPVIISTKEDNKPFLGVTVSPNEVGVRPGTYSTIFGNLFVWLAKLFSWIYIISLGVGLFNLLPLGPIDGGRMFFVLALSLTKDEKKAKKWWTYISFFCLLLIFINLLPYLITLLKYIISLF
jgi:membrane-associated protease RseP (regulator of RpoE activity)